MMIKIMIMMTMEARTVTVVSENTKRHLRKRERKRDQPFVDRERDRSDRREKGRNQRHTNSAIKKNQQRRK